MEENRSSSLRGRTRRTSCKSHKGQGTLVQAPHSSTIYKEKDQMSLMVQKSEILSCTKNTVCICA